MERYLDPVRSDSGPSRAWSSFEKVRFENEPVIQNAKNRGNADQLYELWCNLNYRKVRFDDDVNFILWVYKFDLIQTLK